MIAALAWIGMVWLQLRDPSDRLWLRASIILLPFVVMFCLMRGSEARGARKWDAARAARERKADSD